MNVAQLIANILITTSYIALVGLGFSLIYRTAKFFNMAYAFLFMAGPYSVLLLKVQLSIVLPISILLSVIVVGTIGLFLDIIIYRPLRSRNASALVLLLASLGLYVMLQNAISLIFGDGSINIRFGEIEKGINILGARITNIQILLIGLSVVIIVITSMFIKLTRFGLAVRAVSSLPDLARVSGIRNDLVIFGTTAISSIIVGITGILVAMDVNMNPTMGMSALLVAIVAVLVGGIESTTGVVLGAALLGSAQHIAVWVFGSQWQDAVVFLILLVFLLVRPEGIMGKKLRKATA